MRRDLVATQPLRSVWDTVDGVSIHARVSTRELDQDRIRSGNPEHDLLQVVEATV